MKFTDRSIQALKPRLERYEAWEDNGKGFGLRVGTSGKKTFVYVYRHGGRARRMTLGTYPYTTLAGAHEKHARARRIHKEENRDPGEELQAKVREEAHAETIAQLADIYLEKHAKPNKRSWIEDQRMLKSDVVKRWGHLKARDIKRRHIVELLDAICYGRGAPMKANRTHALLSKMFKVAVHRGILEATPFVEIPKPAKEKPRERVLSETEIRDFWFELDDTKMQLALKLLLVTGQRRAEVAKARKEDFDLTKRLWTIPAENAKNERPHVVPLNNMTFELVEKMMGLSDSPWLVPSPRLGRHIDPATITHEVRTHIHFKGESFTPHDLRRTAATMMTSAGLDARRVGKVLAHTEKGVIKHYDRYDYLKEKRQALAVWEQKLMSILYGDEVNKVVALNSAR